jgi:hypothetical protein
MNTKKVMERTTIMGDNKLIKLDMGVKSNELVETEVKPEVANIIPIELNIPPLPQAVK